MTISFARKPRKSGIAWPQAELLRTHELLRTLEAFQRQVREARKIGELDDDCGQSWPLLLLEEHY